MSIQLELHKCWKCKEEKFRKYFNKDKSRKTGVSPICRNCASIRCRQRSEKDLNKYVYNRCKYSARARKLEFNLDVEDIIIPKTCPLLGIPIVYAKKHRIDGSPSVDRIDNSKGYIKGNIWVISAKANTMKANASVEELRTFCKNCLDIFGN